MLKELKAGFLMMVVLTVITGLIYPAVITAIAQIVWPDQATGSLVTVNGQVVGSRLLGQNFTKAEYFHPRPSAAGANGYDATASGGSNLGPTNAKLVETVRDRVVRYCVENGIAFETPTPQTVRPSVPIPADAVTASASGLDPHISPANADLQAARVAKARGAAVDRVKAIVAQHTAGRTFGFLGEPVVNVLELNLALDQQLRRP